jgi:hypothetical protein
MAYVPNFEYDIFISYAHVDNLTTPTETKGWITTFEEFLEVFLSRRVGEIGTVKIWRDPTLDGSQLFDTTIKNRIKESALFLAFTSTGYLTSDYCHHELEWFHENATTNNLGVNVGDRMRVLNVLLNNIPYQEWPQYFGKTSGYPFFDSENEEDLGYPIKCGGESFETRLRKLVEAIYKTLMAIKDVVAPTASAKTFTKTIYLADTADSLVRYRKRLLNDLGNNVRIVSNVPPPYDAESHQAKVIEAMTTADLSVHLLDDLPGREIQGEEGKSYPQKQVELGLQHAKSQFIWVPNTLELETVEDQGYKTFINELQNGNRGAANYCFIKGSASSISREVTEMLERRPPPGQNGQPSVSAATLVDTHLKDQLHALRLGQFLLEKCIQPYINPEEDDPQKNMKVLEERLKQVNKLIVIFGDVAEEWVRARLAVAVQIAITARVQLKACGVYFAPPRQRGPVGIFNLPFLPVYEFDNRDISNPHNLGPMLNGA